MLPRRCHFCKFPLSNRACSETVVSKRRRERERRGDDEVRKEHIEESASSSQRRTWYMLTSKSVCEMVGLLCIESIARRVCTRRSVVVVVLVPRERVNNTQQHILLSSEKTAATRGASESERVREKVSECYEKKIVDQFPIIAIRFLDRSVSTLENTKTQKRDLLLETMWRFVLLTLK